MRVHYESNTLPTKASFVARIQYKRLHRTHYKRALRSSNKTTRRELRHLYVTRKKEIFKKNYNLQTYNLLNATNICIIDWCAGSHFHTVCDKDNEDGEW